MLEQKQNKSLLLGVTGHLGSGKQKFVEVSKQLYPGFVEQISSSHILANELQRLGLETTRENRISMAKEKGQDWIVNEMEKKINQSISPIKIWDSIRKWPDYFALVKQKGLLVAIYADPVVACERIKNRNEKPGDNNLSLDHYYLLLQDSTEEEISDISKFAVFEINNNGTIKETEEQIRNFYREYYI